MDTTCQVETAPDHADVRATATELLNQMAGNECMIGFVKEITAAAAAYDAIKGVPKPNYRAVRNLAHLVKVSAQVLKIFDTVSQ